MKKMTEKTKEILEKRIEAIAKREHNAANIYVDDSYGDDYFRVDDYFNEIFEGLQLEVIDDVVSGVPIKEYLEDYYYGCIEKLTLERKI